MWRLTDRTVRSTLVTAWFLADWPTRTSPFLANATTEGVVREPSELAMTVGSPPSRTVTTELVVPRSIPTARAMGWPLFRVLKGGTGPWKLRVSTLARGPLNFPDHHNGRRHVLVPRGRGSDAPTAPMDEPPPLPVVVGPKSHHIRGIRAYR